MARRPSISADRRRRLAERDGDECFYCGDPSPATVDHVVPVVMGGTTSDENLVLSCRACNEAKGSLPLDRWLPTMPVFVQERGARLVPLRNRPLPTPSIAPPRKRRTSVGPLPGYVWDAFLNRWRYDSPDQIHD